MNIIVVLNLFVISPTDFVDEHRHLEVIDLLHSVEAKTVYDSHADYSESMFVTECFEDCICVAIYMLNLAEVFLILFGQFPYCLDAWAQTALRLQIFRALSTRILLLIKTPADRRLSKALKSKLRKFA